MSLKVFATVTLLVAITAGGLFGREWRSAMGTFSVEAELVSSADGKVKLKRSSDGKVIEVAISSLSAADREFLAAAGKPAATSSPAAPGPTKLQPAAERLAGPAAFRFEATPLKDAIASLNVPRFIDLAAVEGVGITIDTPVTGIAKDGSLLENLEQLLKPLGLTAELRYDVLFITTPEHQSYVPRAYRLRQAGGAAALVGQVEKGVSPDSWNNVGGAGSVIALGNVLVIFQTQAIHREITAKFGRQLQMVSAAAGRPAGGAGPARGADPLARIRPALGRPATAEFVETPLRDAVDLLQKNNKVKIELDSANLKAVGVSDETLVTLNLKELPLESVLSLFTQRLRLTWTVTPDGIIITTPENAEARLLTVNYDTSDLTGNGDFDTLIDAITSTVAPASWEDVGGAGTIKPAGAGLSIGQTYDVHRTIESWLDDVRQALKPTRGK